MNTNIQNLNCLFFRGGQILSKPADFIFVVVLYKLCVMTNMKQKLVTDQDGKSKKDLYDSDNNDNLGLDADHSSDDSVYKVNLNNDNDRISHNPYGEDDDHDTLEEPGSSPLMDK
ncbi:hypothetical protein SAMN06265348_1114 [Pedobacter westerhofensis]|uniref:Uncharacterized protein n=2 Tax=Pedobacter westerhofensis TaxID=425512 RepID=A0A521FAG2_9SPHI|nr:hypothetical protein SAMN06265348_1114 [Pedobacter westerhofensis]